MSTIIDIKTVLAQQYAAITLPAPFNTAPTVFTSEAAALNQAPPFVVVYDSQSQSINRLSSDRYQVSRLFYARLYTHRIDDSGSDATESNKDEASNCIEPIEDYFMFRSSLLDSTSVIEHVIVRDSSSTVIDTGNDTYVGVVFEHLITYYRYKS